MFFDLFKRKEIPILKPEMLTPVDAPISTADAKRLFKAWMLKIGRLDKQEIPDHVKYFADAMKDEEQGLKEFLDDEKRQVDEAIEERKTEFQDELNDLKEQLSESTDEDEKKALKLEIEDAKKEIRFVKETVTAEFRYFEKTSNALSDFKKDKRAFLVDYINSQVHGQDWRNKL